MVLAFAKLARNNGTLVVNRNDVEAGTIVVGSTFNGISSVQVQGAVLVDPLKGVLISSCNPSSAYIIKTV